MRRLLLLAMLAATTLPSVAAHRITVDELRQMLVARKAANDSDADMAKQIGAQELTEQLTSLTLDRIKDEVKPGPKSALALDLLADCSAFLKLPASEVPSKAPPNSKEIHDLIKATVNFVGNTITHLPDFLAIRSTRSFDDNSARTRDAKPDKTEEELGLIAPQAGLLPAGSANQEITYRDGHEVLGAARGAGGGKQKLTDAVPGLTTKGEFGPALTLVLLDAAKGKMTWSHWEQTAAGMAAVFHFQVPEGVSHYVVDYCCLSSQVELKAGAPDHNFRGQLTGMQLMTQAPGGGSIANSYHGTPAYHGNLYLDAATGAVLRITLDAELKSSDPITRSASSVEYGPVEIGGKSYICPVRSVAISLTRAYTGDDFGIKTILRVNETKFASYHRFGSTVKVLAEAMPQ